MARHEHKEVSTPDRQMHAPKKSAARKTSTGSSRKVETQALIEEAQLAYLPKNPLSVSRRSHSKKNMVSFLSSFNSSEDAGSEFTTIDKMNLIEEGVSKKALENFKTSAQLDYDQLADNLHVARATLINKKGDEKFNQDLSDKILSLIDIYSYGYKVFVDRDAFNKWIFQPNKALGNKPPFSFLSNSFGKQEVKNLIGRIEYGVYS